MAGGKFRLMCPSLVRRQKRHARRLNKSCFATQKAVREIRLSASFILFVAALKSSSSKPPFQVFTSALSQFRQSSIKACFWRKILIISILTSKMIALFRAPRFITNVSQPIHSRLGNWPSLSECWPIMAKSIR